jgi:hypothetical protein
VAAATERVRAAVHDAGPLGVEIAAFTERERAVLPLIDDVVVDAGAMTLFVERGLEGLVDVEEPHDRLVLRPLGSEPHPRGAHGA